MGEWKIPPGLEEWEKVIKAIEYEMVQHGFSDKFKCSLLLAMDEVFANISMYAYKDKCREVEIKSEYITNATHKVATTTFLDSGVRFNPLENNNEPNINEKSALKRKIGGLGIYLIKKQVDEVKYEYVDKFNKLTLIKSEIK